MFIGDSLWQKNSKGTAENASDEAKSLIPMRSPLVDAMSELAPESVPLFPPLAVAIYIGCVAGAGALANCALLAALIKCSKDGLFCIIIQLAVADFFLLGTSIWLELWSSNAKTWMFGTGSCIAYRGLSVFGSTASLYLIITIALHSLATINLEEKAASQVSKTNDDEEIRSSRHSLVASSDTSTPPRTMNVDYKLVNTRVQIALPTIFVWILSASLSVPEFALATTVRIDKSVIECTLVDSSHKRNMYSLLSILNLFLPALIMTTAGALIICKLKSKKKLSRIYTKDTLPALTLSLCLIFVYFIFCAPRSIYYAYEIYTSSENINETVLQKDLMYNLILNAAYLAASVIRPILCMIILPRLRNVFIFGSKSTTVDDV